MCFQIETNVQKSLRRIERKPYRKYSNIIWVGSKIRNKGFMIWIDLRDRYGITQLIIDKDRSNEALFETAEKLGREFVIQAKGEVIEELLKTLICLLVILL